MSFPHVAHDLLFSMRSLSVRPCSEQLDVSVPISCLFEFFQREDGSVVPYIQLSSLVVFRVMQHYALCVLYKLQNNTSELLKTIENAQSEVFLIDV